MFSDFNCDKLGMTKSCLYHQKKGKRKNKNFIKIEPYLSYKNNYLTLNHLKNYDKFFTMYSLIKFL